MASDACGALLSCKQVLGSFLVIGSAILHTQMSNVFHVAASGNFARIAQLRLRRRCRMSV